MGELSRAKTTLLVTGGLGYIGFSAVAALRGVYDIAIVDWDRSSAHLGQAREWGIETVQEDISDGRAWDSIRPCEIVLHAAAQVSAEESKDNPSLDFQTNAVGTVRVAEYARKHGAAVLYCNSIRVYSPEASTAAVREGPCKAVSEDCPLIAERNVWEPPFAVSKLAGEQYLRYYADRFGVPVVSLRMSGVVGPGQRGNPKHAWLAYLVECAVRQRLYRVFGDGEQSRDVLHIDDFLRLLALVLAGAGRPAGGGFTVYNIGGGPANRITLQQAIRLLQTEFGLSWPLEYVAGRRDEPRDFVACVDKVSRLGWAPTLGIDRIVTDLVQWHAKEEPHGNGQ